MIDNEAHLKESSYFNFGISYHCKDNPYKQGTVENFKHLSGESAQKRNVKIAEWEVFTVVFG